MHTCVRMLAAPAAVTLALVFSGCSGHGAPAPGVPPVGAASQPAPSDAGPNTSGTITVNPSNLKIRGTASNDTRTFAVQDTQQGFTGTITAKTSNAGVATVSPASINGPNGTFTVTGTGIGTCRIVLFDGTSHQWVNITVLSLHGIYVTNRGSESVEVFDLASNGNVAPSALWRGSKTLFNTVNLLAVDGNGNVFASNIGPGIAGSVTEYAPNPTGNIAPFGDITGPDTGINTPEGLFVDSLGNTYVSNADRIAEFAPGANGDAVPTRTIVGNKTILSGPYQLTLDSAGNIYTAEGNVILVYAAGASGNVAPTQEITGPATALLSCLGVAVDSTGKIYATNFNGNTINVYAAGTTGNTKPSTVITSTALNEPYNIALDASGNMYVSNFGNNSIVVFPAGSNGATMPSATISGALTGLNQPQGIAVF